MYIWSKLNHKNVLSLVGFIFDDGSLPHMVSEWQENGTLLEYMPKIPKGPKTLLIASHSFFATFHLLTPEIGSRHCIWASVPSLNENNSRGSEERTITIITFITRTNLYKFR